MKSSNALVFGLLFSLPLQLAASDSAPFKVDTRDQDLRILSFDSPYCTGEYGTNPGGKAYIPAGLLHASEDIVFTVKADKDIVGFIYSDNPTVETANNTYRLSLRQLAAGHSLTVTGVDRDGQHTKPFRANFDVIRVAFAPALIDTYKEKDKLLFVMPQTEFKGKEHAGKPDVSLPYVGSGDTSSANAKMGLAPKIEFGYSFDTKGTAKLMFGQYTNRDGEIQVRDANGHFGDCYGFDIDWGYGGEATLQAAGSGFMPQKSTLHGKVSLDARVFKARWPACPAAYCEFKVGGSVMISFSFDGTRYDPDDIYRALGFQCDAVFPRFTLAGGLEFSDNVKASLEGEGDMKFAFSDRLRDIGLDAAVAFVSEVKLKLWKWELWDWRTKVDLFSGEFGIYPDFGVRSSHNIFQNLWDSLFNSPNSPRRRILYTDDGAQVLYEGVADLGSVLHEPFTLAMPADGALPDSIRLKCDGSAISDNGTGDLYPSTDVISDGSRFVAWMDLNTVLGSSSDGGFLAASDIAVAVRAQEGGWSVTKLTNDGIGDSFPSISAANDDSAVVIWRRNAEPHLIGTPDSPGEIWFSKRSTSGVWSPASKAFATSGILIGQTVAWNGSKGSCVFLADADGDINTVDDLEVYESIYDGNSWSTPVQLTNDALADACPHAWFEDDVACAAWRRDGQIVVKRGTGPVAAVPVCDAGIGDFEVVMRNGALKAIVLLSLSSRPQSSATEVYACILNDGVWSKPVQVTESELHKDGTRSSFVNDSTLRIIYRTPRPDGLADLRVVTKTIAAEPRVAQNGISVVEESVAMDEDLTIRVTAENAGLLPASNVRVSLYATVDGAEECVGETVVPSLNGGDRTDVNFIWKLRASTSDVVLRAVVGGDEQRKTLLQPDLSIESVTVADGIGERYVRARVCNRGAVTVPSGVRVDFRLGDKDGTLIGSDTLGTMRFGADGEYVATVRLPASAVFTGARQQLTAIVDPAETVSDSNRANNTMSYYMATDVDTDGDGLTDAAEEDIGSNPQKRDTDDDGFSDYDEVMVYGTSPLMPSYQVTFDLGKYADRTGGGELEQVVDAVDRIAYPVFVEKKGYRFLKWDVALPSVLTSALKLTAVYIPAPRDMTPVASKDAFAGAVTYAGWLKDADGFITASFAATVARPGKDNAAKVKATVISLVTGKKRNLSGSLPVGEKVVKGAGDLAGLSFTSTGAFGKFESGEFAGLEVVAVVDLAKSKDTEAADVFSLFKDRVFDMSLQSYDTASAQPFAAGYGAFSTVFSKNGKAKVSGFLPDGSKVSITLQLLLTKDGCCLPVFYSKSGKSWFAFALWFDRKAELVAMPVTNMSQWKSPSVGTPVSWIPVASRRYSVPTSLPLTKFGVETPNVEAWFGPLVAFPFDVPITVSANLKKWDAGKVASLKLKGGVVLGTDDPAKPNLTGLKLTFKPKDGTFNGSFSAVSLSETGSKPRLVKSKAAVNGVVVDGKGYGTAVIKNTGSMPVTVGK